MTFPMAQFWLYALDDGRRILVEANVAQRYDPWIGFGIQRGVLPALRSPGLNAEVV